MSIASPVAPNASTELLRLVVDLPGVELQTLGPLPNRQSLVARLPGTVRSDGSRPRSAEAGS